MKMNIEIEIENHTDIKLFSDLRNVPMKKRLIEVEVTKRNWYE